MSQSRLGEGAVSNKGTDRSLTGRPGRAHVNWRRMGAPYRLLVVFAVPWLVFTVYPLVKTVVLSFENANLLGGSRFSGMANYVSLSHDSLWWHAVELTVAYAAIVVVGRTGIAVGLGLALVRCGASRFSTIMRAVLFFPYVLSVSVVTIIWGWIANPQYGALTLVPAALGAGSVNWFGFGFAFWLVVIIKTWWWLGFSVLIIHAGLLQIPSQYYEAAAVDGASPWRAFSSVTIPFILPELEFLAVVGFAQELQVFALPVILTGGGPGHSTFFALQDFYETAFQQFRLGYASAMAIILTLLALVVGIAARGIARRSMAVGV